MSLTHALRSLALALGLGLTVAGCSDSDRNPTYGASSGTAPMSSSATPVPGAPASPVSPASGIVTRLTGDDDSLVTPQLERIVFAALARGADDQALEGF